MDRLKYAVDVGICEKKTIIIKSNSLAFLSDVDCVYRQYFSYNLLARVLRRIAKKMKLNFVVSFFYGRWKKYIRECDVVVLFDGGVDDVNMLARFIKKNNSCLRLIFWYWNPIKPGDTVHGNSYIDEIWTYSRFDAEQYDLKLNSQFYRKMEITKGKSFNADMVFVGANKGRRGILEQLRGCAEAQGLNCNFMIVGTKKDYVNYVDYLSMLTGSKCIVDIVPNQSCGLTLRPLEALFYEKKLITNYEDIVNYDFYDKENIFILGKDDIGKLAEFVNGRYKKIDKKIVDFYSYENWLRRIEQGESVEP